MTSPDKTNEEPVPTNPLELTAQIIRECRDCPLADTRTNAVPGEGPITARVMIIAEGPGEHEDRQGRPFMGQAGRFLDELLPMAGLTRNDVYITNMIKCRAPGNRDPKPEELAACDQHLEIQINQLRPKLIITLGGIALNKFLPGQKPSQARGKLRCIEGRFVYPVMHPAAGLRRGDFKQHVINDFKAIPEILRRIDQEPPDNETIPEPATKKNVPEPGASQASFL